MLNYLIFALLYYFLLFSDSVISSDGKEMIIPHLISEISDNCSTLVSKPKMFFIQACQGTHIPQDFGEPVYREFYLFKN